jgi:SAM-dependent methyltransferase
MEAGATNVRFEVGNVNALPFPDASFDVAFANAVLMHMRDPIATLREMRRVVRPGGFIAVRDHGDRFREPRTGASKRFAELLNNVAQENLGRPGSMLGMRHRHLLIEAGCTPAEGFADVVTYGEPTRLREHLQLMRGIVSDDDFRRSAARAGYDDATLAHLLDDLEAWYARPDAVVVVIWSAGIGWVE